MNYADFRNDFYTRLREEGIFTWDFLYGEEYALGSLYSISRQERQEIALATELLGRIYAKTVAVFQQGDDKLLAAIGIPKEALAAVRIVTNSEITTLVGRFDFAQTPQGLKMLEFNSDTPTSVVEAYYVNGKFCAAKQVADPNAGMTSHLGQTFAEVKQSFKDQGYKVDNIFFSALDWHEEDSGTTRYLLQQAGIGGAFCALSDLRVLDDLLYVQTATGLTPVDLLYRLHPIEKLAAECDEDGYPTGAHVLDIIARRKLAIINPPSAFIAQSKALQALIWNLYEGKQFFDTAEREIIGTYMLPTYLDSRFAAKCAYVTKPFYGREGGAVTMFAKDGTIIAKDAEDQYWRQPVVYQQCAKLPTVTVETLKGFYEGRLLWGSFLIGARASAIVARLGGVITDNLSYYLPVGIKD